MKINSCCLCLSNDIYVLPNLFDSGLANNLEASAMADSNHDLHPLGLAICNNCDHVQLSEFIDPKILFENYKYKSSVSNFFCQHFSNLAAALDLSFQESKLDKKILDIGSNDGFLLDCFKKLNWDTFGVEPAKNLAIETGVNHQIFNCFFNKTFLALNSNRKYDLITANNVFAHTRDIGDFAETVSQILSDEGLFVFEVQYLPDLVNNCLFDMIYHEHTSYHHLTPLVKILPSYGLHVCDVEHINSHGGSIRVYCRKAALDKLFKPSQSVSLLLDSESKFIGSQLKQTILSFYYSISKSLEAASQFLIDLYNNNFTIVGYTAPAKATTLLSGLTSQATSCLDYIIDDSPLKSNQFIPGTDIKILTFKDYQANIMSSDLRAQKYAIVIFAWNIAESLVSNLRISNVFPRETKFYKLLPEPQVLK